MLQKSTLQFLTSLSKNNNKVWFDAHRKKYETAKTDFGEFVSQLIHTAAGFDSDLNELQVKDCTFRINRDIRFSKDKTPYKQNFAASFNRGGKKSIYAGYYFHLEPGNKSFIGGGIWMPLAPELHKIRQEIDYSFAEFKEITENKNFIKYFKCLENSSEVRLTNLPRGYQKDNPAAEYLKLKSVIASKPLKDKEVISTRLLEETSTAFHALQPLINFLNRALE